MGKYIHLWKIQLCKSNKNPSFLTLFAKPKQDLVENLAYLHSRKCKVKQLIGLPSFHKLFFTTNGLIVLGQSNHFTKIKTSLILTSCPTLRTCVVCQKRLFLPARYLLVGVFSKEKKLVGKPALPVLKLAPIFK